jgi:hypothetical protein
MHDPAVGIAFLYLLWAGIAIAAATIGYIFLHGGR